MNNFLRFHFLGCHYHHNRIFLCSFCGEHDPRNNPNHKDLSAFITFVIPFFPETEKMDQTIPMA